MAHKSYKPYTPSRRFITTADFSELSKKEPEKRLISSKVISGGRNAYGHQTNINIGGGHKRAYRIIDFKRNKLNVVAKVEALEYDPNRSARIALLKYVDGERRYILAPQGLKVGQTVSAGTSADIQPGNALPLANIPAGVFIHNIELKPGRGGQIVRTAGSAAQLVAKEADYVQVRLPSGEVRKFLATCYASIGQLGNADHKNIVIGKAGRSRWLSIRPHNRGVTKNPVDHPMGGGAGKTSGGRHPCSPMGILSKGLKTRRNKRSTKFIVKRKNRK